MNRRIHPLAAFLGLAVLAPASAQPPGGGSAPAVPAAPVAASTTRVAEPGAEEVEIMRRLLDMALDKQRHPMVDSRTNPNQPLATFDYQPSSITGTGGTTSQGASLSPYIGTIYGPIDGYATNTVQEPNYNYQYWLAEKHIASRSKPEKRPVEGVYLKGFGAIYTTTIDLALAAAVADVRQPPSRQALSDWEKARRELRGEPLEPTKAVSHETIADSILKVLAKNGQHLTHLDENEQVAVVVTLPRAQACVQCHGKPATSANSSGGASLVIGSNSSGGASIFSGTFRTNGSSGSSSMDARAGKLEAMKADFQKQVLLGDLHMKQNKMAQAATAYESALKAWLDSPDLQSLSSAGSKETSKLADWLKEYGIASAKLMEAYASLGKVDEMQRVMQVLKDYSAKVAQVQHKNTLADNPSARPATSERQEIPAKLIVSAPKKLLELVGSGKVSFDEFRSTATVQYRAAAAIDKPASK